MALLEFENLGSPEECTTIFNPFCFVPAPACIDGHALL
jgi:hypothetical protein